MIALLNSLATREEATAHRQAIKSEPVCLFIFSIVPLCVRGGSGRSVGVVFSVGNKTAACRVPTCHGHISRSGDDDAIHHLQHGGRSRVDDGRGQDIRRGAINGCAHDATRVSALLRKIADPQEVVAIDMDWLRKIRRDDHALEVIGQNTCRGCGGGRRSNIEKHAFSYFKPPPRGAAWQMKMGRAPDRVDGRPRSAPGLVRLNSQAIQRAMPKAAAAARPPMSMVCDPLRSMETPVNLPLTEPKTPRQIRVTIMDTIKARCTSARIK